MRHDRGRTCGCACRGWRRRTSRRVGGWVGAAGPAWPLRPCRLAPGPPEAAPRLVSRRSLPEAHATPLRSGRRAGGGVAGHAPLCVQQPGCHTVSAPCVQTLSNPVYHPPTQPCRLCGQQQVQPGAGGHAVRGAGGRARLAPPPPPLRPASRLSTPSPDTHTLTHTHMHTIGHAGGPARAPPPPPPPPPPPHTRPLMRATLPPSPPPLRSSSWSCWTISRC